MSAQEDPQDPAPAALVVVGASFAGLELLYQLEGQGYWRTDPPPRVYVVDQCESAPYLPLIHEEVLQEGSPSGSIPFRRYLEALSHVHFVRAKVTRVDLRAREVLLEEGRILKGEGLVVALGSELKAPPSIDPHGLCYVLKSQAHKIRLQARLQTLLREAKEAERPRRVVVIGGGLSGVELAAELALAHPKGLALSLVQGEGTLLPTLAPRAGRLAQAQLRKLGVELLLHTRVQRVGEGAIEVLDAQGVAREIPMALALWAGGVQGPSGVEWVGTPVVGKGWIGVDPQLRIWSSQGEALEGCFAIGDIAAISDEAGQTPWPVMRRAIEAIWQAKTLGRRLGPRHDRRPHGVQLHWPYGVSVGTASLLCYRGWAVDLGALGRWFRRWLGAMYRRRYGLQLPETAKVSSNRASD